MHSYPTTYLFLQAQANVNPKFFYIAIAFTTALILVLVMALLVMLLLKNEANLKHQQLQSQFKDWLVGIILEETDEHHQSFDVPENIRQLLKKRFAKRVLLQELKGLKYSLSGQPGQNLEKVYRQLDLQLLSSKNLRSKKWHLKARGIQEVAAMNHTELIEDITLLTNNKNPGIRMEAQIALVLLQQYKGLHFFENLVYPLTEWHQIKLLQLLANQPIPSEEVITKWLLSSNASVVQFTLKLIGEQHASHFQNEVISCLSHKSEIVRKQAIICLGEIPSAPAASALKFLYAHETDKELQMTILAELIKTGTATDVPFLLELQQTQDADIKLAIDKALSYLQEQVVS
ncbi:HEAT repeat domain-containing protein [Rufibacter tibetensis]|uniref:HEAT repeat domain-containing protein n=1 Tax=Rufibacter tibetensis TaxID=512763 RepID=UPI0012F7F8D4